MGIYRPVVEKFQGERQENGVTPSNNILTVPTAFGSLRIPLAIAASRKIIKGEKWATPYVAAMWVTDAEGFVAGKMDKHFPELGRGSSEFGEKADVTLDVASALILGSAILAGPNITKTAKLATASILGKEGVKAAWYLQVNPEYKAALRDGNVTNIHNLVVPTTYDTKESIIEEGVGMFFAAATNDTSNPYLRAAYSGLAMAHCSVATVRGEIARRQNDAAFTAQLAPLTAGEQTTFVAPSR